MKPEAREARFGWVTALIIGALGLVGGFVVSTSSALGFSTPAEKMAAIIQTHADDKEAQGKVDAAQDERIERLEGMDDTLESIARKVGADIPGEAPALAQGSALMPFDRKACFDAGRRVLGNPYKLGSNFDYSVASPKGGIDCSGLVLWMLARGGVKLPDMTAADLYARTYATGVIKPGDLGFQKPEGGPVDHVVMLTDDPDAVIEARSCSTHLGHTAKTCPYNKVILRPRAKWEAWHLFTGFRRLRDIDIADGLPG